MNLQKKLDFIEAYRNYIQLSGRAEAGIEISVCPSFKPGIRPEGFHDTKEVHSRTEEKPGR